jgi:hypothetical protein
MQEEILIRIALIEIAQEEADALEADESAPNPLALRAVERALKRRNLTRFAKRTLPRIAQAAAAVVLLFYLALTTVLAVSADAREKFMTLFVNVTPYYSELSLNPIEPTYVTAPEGWTEKYYPEYIPEGWTLDGIDKFFADALYLNAAKDKHLRFSVYTEDAAVNINTEGAEISHVSLNGIMSMVAENKKEGFTWVTWSTGDRMILVYIDGDMETALDIAVSVLEVEGYQEPAD